MEVAATCSYIGRLRLRHYISGVQLAVARSSIERGRQHMRIESAQLGLLSREEAEYPANSEKASWTTEHESMTYTRSPKGQQAKAWRGSVSLAAATKNVVKPRKHSFQASPRGTAFSTWQCEGYGMLVDTAGACSRRRRSASSPWPSISCKSHDTPQTCAGLALASPASAA